MAVLDFKGLTTGDEDSPAKLQAANSEQTRQEKQEEDREKAPWTLPPCRPPPPNALYTQTADPGIVKSGKETAAKKENISSYQSRVRVWAWAPAHGGAAETETACCSHAHPPALLSSQPCAGPLWAAA